MVSAPSVAKERNIEISEVTCEDLDEFQTKITLLLTTETQTRAVSGTLFAGNKPRLVEIKGISIDAELGPHMLYITNEDKPGFIGDLGTTLGQNNINIATFSLGRNKAGGDAIALIEIDQPVTEHIIENVRQLPHVMRVLPLSF